MKKIVCLFFAMFFSFNANAQSLVAQVNSNKIQLGQSIQLKLTLSGAKATTEPDFGVLEKDFKVYSVSNSFQTKIINGQMNQNQEWILTLVPIGDGLKIIPSIQIGGYKSEPIEIEVISSPLEQENQDDEPTNVFDIRADISNTSPYVQEQIIYTVKIYDQGQLEGSEPSFVGLNPNEWVVEPIGQPEVKSKNINGKNIRQISFKYALFAQKSGELTIPPMQFSGYYFAQEDNGFRSVFDTFLGSNFISDFGIDNMFVQKKPVVLSEPAKKIYIKPALTGINWWLPSTQVKLKAQFKDPNPQFKVGEAVSRDVYLQAEGVLPSQLPDIEFADIKGIKQYPEKPETSSSFDGQKLVSVKKITNVYIPSESGEYMLPALKIKWFDVISADFKEAIIPSSKVNVLASDNSLYMQSQPSFEEPQNITDTPATDSYVPLQKNWIIWIAFFAGFILSFIILRLLQSTAGKSPNYRKIIIRQAKRRDLRGLQDSLIEWSRLLNVGHKINNLKDVAKHISNLQIKPHIENLSKEIYSPHKMVFDSKAFIKEFKKENKYKKASEKIKPLLPPLYK